MRLIVPSDSPQDVAAAALASALLVLSATSAGAVLRIRRRCRRRLHDLVNPLWLVRLLLPLFATLWSIAELLPSPIFRRRLPPPLSRRLAFLCHAHLLASQALAEPAFLTVILFLLRASIRPKPASSASAFAFALSAALLSAFPFLALHALYLSVSIWDLRRLGFPPDLFGLANGVVVHLVQVADGATSQCSYPLFGTVLLAALVAVYVPVFISASWGAVSVVINRRLRARLYVLSVAVVGALSVQVASLALSTLWEPRDPTFRWLSLTAAAAVVALAMAGEAILVIWPIIDTLSVGEAAEASPENRRSMFLERARDVERQQQEDVGGNRP